MFTKESMLDQKKSAKARTVLFEIEETLRTSGYGRSEYITLATYLLYRVSRTKYEFPITFDTALNSVNPEIADMAKRRLNDTVWSNLSKLLTSFSSEDLLTSVLLAEELRKDSMELRTPESIRKLAYTILDAKRNDCVADICCGAGGYLIAAALEQPEAKYYGFDINCDKALTAQMRSEMIDADISIDAENVFDLDISQHRFSKIFSNYPFGIRARMVGAGDKFMKRFEETYPGAASGTSGEWLFNALICDLLEENGKAVVVMPNGCTWNKSDAPMRKHFTENGMIECVITLPNRMFESTNISTTMLVLSRGNDAIRMIDASEICQQLRRENTFSNDDIQTIISAMRRDSDYSKLVTREELCANDYVLGLKTYVTQQQEYDNGVAFGDLAMSITRGAPCTAKTLDELVSVNPTNLHYLMLSNIKNGMIDEELPFLREIETKYEKYCLQQDDLIMSKNGYPYKIAVAEVADGQKIMASGNLFVIHLDTNRVNPYYIKAFFESEQGIEALNNICLGTTIPSLSLEKLKGLIVPVPSMEEQMRIANKYRDTQAEIADLQRKLESAVDRLGRIFPKA